MPDLPKPEYDPKDVAFNNEFETKCGWNKMNEYPEPPKKIIGYKLIKPEYKEAVIYIAKQHPEHSEQDFYFNKHWHKFIIPRLENAGILNIWFEPVYDKSITLKSGVKLSEDDIAEVKEILNNK